MRERDSHYNDYGSYVRKLFSGRVHKISLHAGLTCPNRDGTKGRGGCTYCNNNSFSTVHREPIKSITDQLNEGIERVCNKSKNVGYLAYFQTYTNTYGDPEQIISMIREASVHPAVKGIVIGTRPDCINDELISFLSQLSQKLYISIEFGIESTLNKTLHAVNRCHTFEDSVAAFDRCKGKGIHLGAHIILGLPGETRDEILSHAQRISELPIETLKIHHLQIVKQTIMSKQYRESPESFNLFEFDEYIDLVIDFITFLRSDIVIERFITSAPKHLLIAPIWGGFKNYTVAEILRKKLLKENLWQGKYHKQPLSHSLT